MPEAPDPAKASLWRELDQVARGIDPALNAEFSHLRPHLRDHIAWREDRRLWRLYWIATDGSMTKTRAT